MFLDEYMVGRPWKIRFTSNYSIQSLLEELMLNKIAVFEAEGMGSIDNSISDFRVDCGHDWC